MVVQTTYVGLAISLLRLVQVNTTLVELLLSNTRFGTKGCVVLAEGLRSNSTLEALYLDGNTLGADGARHLMHALNANSTV